MITLSELLHSRSAENNGISNVPTEMQIMDNLSALLVVLNKVRSSYGKPIRVTSGYRCPKLNKLVGGAPNSAHLHGLAADIVLLESSTENYLSIQKLFSSFASALGYNSIVIYEYPKNGVPSWLHLELSKVKPSNVLTIK